MTFTVLLMMMMMWLLLGRGTLRMDALAPSFLKEARSLVKVCYEQKDYASKNTFIPASQGSGRSHLCILTFV